MILHAVRMNQMGGYADPALAANSFGNAAREKGVEVLQRTEATGLRIEAGMVKGVITSKGEISTRTVINIAGVWGGRIAGMAA
jgi:sarcosine oxidase, subunit beta